MITSPDHVLTIGVSGPSDLLTFAPPQVPLGAACAGYVEAVKECDRTFQEVERWMALSTFSFINQRRRLHELAPRIAAQLGRYRDHHDTDFTLSIRDGAQAIQRSDEDVDHCKGELTAAMAAWNAAEQARTIALRQAEAAVRTALTNTGVSWSLVENIHIELKTLLEDQPIIAFTPEKEAGFTVAIYTDGRVEFLSSTP